MPNKQNIGSENQHHPAHPGWLAHKQDDIILLWTIILAWGTGLPSNHEKGCSGGTSRSVNNVFERPVFNFTKLLWPLGASHFVFAPFLVQWGSWIAWTCPILTLLIFHRFADSLESLKYHGHLWWAAEHSKTGYVPPWRAVGPLNRLIQYALTYVYICIIYTNSSTRW